MQSSRALTHVLTIFFITSCFSAPSGSAVEQKRPIQPESAWVRVGGDAVLSGFWNLYQAEVVKIPGNDFPYRIWFFGWASEDCNPGYPGCDAVFHARSNDLFHWEVYCGHGTWDGNADPKLWVPVLVAGNEEYDCWHVGDPSVVFKDGMFYMAFSSTSKPGYRDMKNHNDGMLLCVMGATSPDGIHWKKTEAPLLIEPETVRHATSDETWLGDFHRPALLWDRTRWRLWFDYWAGREKGVCLGLAENPGDFEAPGGFQVVNDLKHPLIVNWPNPDVVRIGDTYHCFGDPTGYPPHRNSPHAGWTSRAVCEAVSVDGKNWKVVGFIRPDPDAAACHVPQAFLEPVDRRLFVFYATQRGGNPDYDFRYDRIRAIRKTRLE